MCDTTDSQYGVKKTSQHVDVGLFETLLVEILAFVRWRNNRSFTTPIISESTHLCYRRLYPPSICMFTTCIFLQVRNLQGIP